MSRRRFIGWTLANTGLFAGVGCGTIMHPERRGQPAGPLDWKIVALDAVGLLLFFVPGVIAFAVDFSNGTIYLPPDQHGLNAPKEDGKELVTVRLPREPMTLRKLEEVVSQHVERDLHLSPGTYQTEELKSIDEFWTAAGKHRDRQKAV